MAMGKDIVIAGFTTTYHRVSRDGNERLFGRTEVEIASYKDEATREANIMDFIGTPTHHSLEGMDLTETQIYAALSAESGGIYEGATQV